MSLCTSAPTSPSSSWTSSPRCRRGRPHRRLRLADHFSSGDLRQGRPDSESEDAMVKTWESQAGRARTERSLDSLNFFLADVRDGLGPCLAVYLLTVRHWNEAEIGLVMSVAGLSGIVAQTPAGALVDVTHYKRFVIVAAAVTVTLASIAIPFLTSLWPMAAAQAASGAAGAIFPPAIAAITLGIVGHAQFARRTGRNEAFNHGGNAFAAATAGSAAYVWGPIVVFFLMAFMAVARPVRGLLVTPHA